MSNTLIHVGKPTMYSCKKVVGVISYISSGLGNNIIGNESLCNVSCDISDTSGMTKVMTIKDEYLPYIENMELNGYYELHINSVGEGGILVSNENGDIENGEYIVASTTGFGVKQKDDIMRSSTVAKALESVVWDDEVIGENGCFEQDGIKCKMIACTYHCG